MKMLLPLLLIAAAPAPEDHPRTYLLSIVDLPLEKGESIESFSFDTWGVAFKAVCRIPAGWRIKAGSSATPDGTLEGGGSHGATWFQERSPAALREFVLVTLVGDVQREEVRDAGGSAAVPPTFKGTAVISTEAGEREVGLGYGNVALTPARGCAG